MTLVPSERTVLGDPQLMNRDLWWSEGNHYKRQYLKVNKGYEKISPGRYYGYWLSKVVFFSGIFFKKGIEWMKVTIEWSLLFCAENTDGKCAIDWRIWSAVWASTLPHRSVSLGLPRSSWVPSLLFWIPGFHLYWHEKIWKIHNQPSQTICMFSLVWVWTLASVIS